jgi:hypothetical protein
MTDEQISQRRDGKARHPSTSGLLKHFKYAHLSEERQAASRPCGELALLMADTLPEGPELSAGLRKLLEAKDCFVRTLV